MDDDEEDDGLGEEEEEEVEVVEEGVVVDEEEWEGIASENEEDDEEQSEEEGEFPTGAEDTEIPLQWEDLFEQAVGLAEEGSDEENVEAEVSIGGDEWESEEGDENDDEEEEDDVEIVLDSPQVPAGKAKASTSKAAGKKRGTSFFHVAISYVRLWTFSSVFL